MAKGFREKSAKYRAVVKNRRALRARGMSRYEVRGLASDKDLLRAIAKQLANNDSIAQQLRSELVQKVAPNQEPRNVWEWLRSSPLVGVDWYIEREFEPGRKIDL